MNTKKKQLFLSVIMLLISAILLSTASFAWFSMNTTVKATGIKFEAYSDSLFLVISQENDKNYDVTTTFESGEKSVRLSTMDRLTDGAYLISPEDVDDGTRYKSDDNINYFVKVTSAQSNDSYEGSNYLLINDRLHDASSVAGYYKVSDTNDEIVFNLIKTADVYDASANKSYYKKVGNNYELQTSLVDGVTELYSYYEIEFKNPCAAGERYDGKSVYYSVDNNGNVRVVGGLALGSLVQDYFTIETPQSKTTVADGTSTYHVLNARGDFVSIGVPEKDTDLTDYVYFARSYSDSITNSGAGNTLSVIKEDRLDEYYIHNTVYLKKEVDTNHGTNLRVSAVEVLGKDSVSDSIRILFVAKNGKGEIARADYNNRTQTITHWDNANANNEGILFDTILGNEQEIVTVDIYIYFDGTDNSTVTKDHYMTGQSVSVEFSIDKPEYIKN